MKKELAFLMVTALLLGAAGCGSGGQSAETTAETAADETTQTDTAASDTSSTENSSSGSELTGDPIKIGFTTVLTGDRSLEGEYGSNAAALVEEEINAAGGVLGRPIEIVIEDALGTDVGAVNAYRKLAADDDIVAIIGSDSSNDNIAISGSVLEAQIPTIAQGSSPTLEALCNDENSYMFQIRTCDSTLCDALIQYAVEEQGLETFAEIHDTEAASADQARLFTEALAKYGIEPTVTVPFTTGTKDFSSHLVQIQNTQPDAVIGAMFHTEAAILVQQMRSMGMDMPIFGSNAFGDPITIELAGEYMNNVFSVTGWVPNTPNEKGAAFSQKYTETYGDECAMSAAKIYDMVYLICEAVERAGSTDRDAVRDAMNTIDHYEGAMTVYDCRTNGACGRGGLVVEVVDGVQTIRAEVYSEKEI